MAENEKQSLMVAGAQAATAFSQIPLPYRVGMGVTLAANHWDGHSQSQKGCTEIQQVGEKYFKVDTCNDKVEEMRTSGSSDGKQASSSSANPVSSPEPALSK